MKKFLVIYTSPAEAMAQMANATEEEKMKGMEPWMKWQKKMGAALVDMGAPLMPGQATNNASNWSTVQNETSGYSIIQAESLEAAQALCEGHPHLGWHPKSTLTLHECVAM